MLELLVFAALGVGAGVVTGLLPGIHPNTIAALLVSAAPVLLAAFSAEAVIVFIVAMAIANAFLGFIPSTFLGMPDGETSLSVLPGHRYLLEGRGYEAVSLTVVGGLGVVLLSLALLPVLFLLLPLLYAMVRSYIAPLLAGVVALMILGERGWGRVKGMTVFVLSGALGILTLAPQFAGSAILFPVFTGLFGISALLLSYLSGAMIPPQRTGMAPVERRAAAAGIGKGFVSGLVVGILPGIGPSEATVLVSQLTPRRGRREFMVALGGISAVSTLFSLLALYLINKPRSGAAVAIEQVIGALTLQHALLLVATAVFAAGTAALLTLRIAHRAALILQRVNYRLLVAGVVAFLVAMTALLTGPGGLLVLVTAMGIGLLPPLWGIRRAHAMGVLMLPIILLFSGILT